MKTLSILLLALAGSACADAGAPAPATPAPPATPPVAEPPAAPTEPPPMLGEELHRSCDLLVKAKQVLGGGR